MMFYKLSRYRYCYFLLLLLLSTSKQDVNFEQGSMLYLNNKHMSLGEIMLRLYITVVKLRHRLLTPFVIFLSSHTV